MPSSSPQGQPDDMHSLRPAGPQFELFHDNKINSNEKEKKRSSPAADSSPAAESASAEAAESSGLWYGQVCVCVYIGSLSLGGDMSVALGFAQKQCACLCMRVNMLLEGLVGFRASTWWHVTSCGNRHTHSSYAVCSLQAAAPLLS